MVDFSGTQAEKEAWAAGLNASAGVSIQNIVGMMDDALGNPETHAQISGWCQNVESHGVLSMTARPDDILMLAHYANSHSGYCVELDATIQPLSLAYRVHYAEQRPVFRLFDPDRVDIVTRTLLHKADFWRHEREWRIGSFQKRPNYPIKVCSVGGN